MTDKDYLKTLEDIFTKKLLRIPDYQRGYSWEHNQLADFWDDIENLDENKKHYAGMLTIKKISDSNKIKSILSLNDDWKLAKGSNFKLFYVVDGQQRLTTAIILIHCLIIHFGNKKFILNGNQNIEDIRKKYLYDIKNDATKSAACILGYEDPLDPSYNYFRFEIFNCAGYPSVNQTSKTTYTKNLEYAVEFFTKKISELAKNSGENAVEDIFEKLTAHFMFNLYEIDDELDEYVTFETMNNRGKKLSNLELLKNRLIYLTTLFDDTFSESERENLRGEINRAWKEIYLWLGKQEESNYASDDDFLRQHWIIYYKIPGRKRDEIMNFFMHGKFLARNLQKTKGDKIHGKTTYEDIKKYVTSLHDYVKFYYYTYYPANSPLPDDDKRILFSLTPAANRLSLGEFRPLLMAVLYRKNSDSGELSEFFNALERLIFIHALQKSTRSDFGVFSYIYAQEFHKGEKNLKKITSELKKAADNDVKKSLWLFKEQLVESFEKKDGGYYKFKEILRHVLYEYECELAKGKINKIIDVKTLFESDRGKNISIEHIFPQNPNSDSQWNKDFDGLSPAQIYILQNSLGNLLLLSHKINASLQNFDFAIKKDRYKYDSHSAIEISQNNQWTAAEILSRTKKLLDFIEKRWQISLSEELSEKLIAPTP